jgi:GNAT superfamily N-acetyltransferase
MPDAEIFERSSEALRLLLTYKISLTPARKMAKSADIMKKKQRMIQMKQNFENNHNVCPGYYYYDSKLAITPEELQDLYRFTRWGRSRSLEQIEKMLEGTSMSFSVRYNGKLVAFCRIITDFVYRGSLWDILVHPDHQGKGLGSSLLGYALNHPAIKPVPLIVTYTSELIDFMCKLGFETRDGLLILQRRPIEYS